MRKLSLIPARFFIFLRVLILGAISILLASSSQAAIYDITMTVDNGYGLYSGTADNLTFIGQSDTWTVAEKYSVDLSDGDYLYLYAWDEGSVEGFVGQFIAQDSNFESFITDIGQGWEYAPASYDLRTGVQSLTAMESALAGAQWNSVEYFLEWSRWRVSPASFGIDSDSVWIWGDLQDRSTTSPSFFFRREIVGTSTVPEPATLILFGSGLVGFAFRRKK